jgi:DNA/RNA endonuclease YhcR with UshA esterase domain
MKPFSLLLGSILSVAVIAVLLLTFGMKPRGPTEQGAALYNVATESTIKGTVRAVEDYTCPVSENEIGRHLQLQTATGTMEIHLAPARVMRSQKFTFSPGDQIEVLGSKMKIRGKESIIAREVTRGNESFFIRDHEGKLLLIQQ